MGEAEVFKAFEAGGWSAQAATYGDLIGAITSRLAEPLLDAAGVRHDQRVLDIGSGPGYVSERAAARGARPVGIDLSDGMIKQARRLHPGLEFLSADAEHLPFEGASFDVAVGGFVINHLPHPEQALNEVARILVSGGAVAFSVWDRPERMRVMGVMSEAISAAGVERGTAVPTGPDPYRFADEREFRALLEGVGCTEVVVEPVELTQRVASVEKLWSGFLGSSVRTAALIRAQSTVVRERIRAELEGVVEPYRLTDGALELPIAARIASGRKPS